MLTELKIREITPDDAAHLIAYTKRVGAESDNLTFDGDGFPVTPEKEAELLQAIADDPHSVMLGVFCGEEMIANGSVNGLPRRMSHRADLAITVVKAEWNKGVGNMLMERLIGEAKKMGVELLYLEVRHDNRAAIHLYEKFGFQQIGRLPAYFKIGDAYIDFLAMYLDLR